MKNSVKQAFIDSTPVMAGYVVLGIGFGILLVEHGFGLGWALAMSVLIYSGTLQYVGPSLLASQASVLTVFITATVMSFRHFFYGISVLSKYRDAGIYKPYMIFALTDETFSIVCRDDEPVDNIQRYRFFLSLFNQSYWVIGSVLGVLLSHSLNVDFTGVDFSMTALFVATFVQQWKTSGDHTSGLIGIVATSVCLLIFGPDQFLIPSMLAITALLTLCKGKEIAHE